MSDVQVWVCKAGDDVVRPARPHLVPQGHHVKDPSGVGGRWCEAGYVQGFPCGGPASPQTFHYGPHPDCPECGSDLGGAA